MAYLSNIRQTFFRIESEELKISDLFLPRTKSDTIRNAGKQGGFATVEGFRG